MGRFSSVTIAVTPVPALLSLSWAEGPEEVSNYDWMFGFLKPYEAICLPSSVLGGIPKGAMEIPGKLETITLLGPDGLPLHLPDFRFVSKQLTFPRLVRRSPVAELMDVSQAWQIGPLEGFSRVYRALRRETKPYHPGSRARRVILEVAQRAGILTRFNLNWQPDWADFPNDSLGGWITATYYVRALSLLLSLLEQGFRGEGLFDAFFQQIAIPIDRKALGESFAPSRSEDGSAEKAMGVKLAWDWISSILAQHNRVSLNAIRRLLFEEASRRFALWTDGDRVWAVYSLLDLALMEMARRGKAKAGFCRLCGAPMQGRRDRKYCSDACRVAAYRKRGTFAL